MKPPIIGDAPLTWICADKRTMTLDEMETSHIRNSIAKIRRAARINEEGKLVGWRIKFLKPLVEELECRGSKDSKSLNPSRLSNRFRNLDLN